MFSATEMILVSQNLIIGGRDEKKFKYEFLVNIYVHYKNAIGIFRHLNTSVDIFHTKTDSNSFELKLEYFMRN